MMVINQLILIISCIVFIIYPCVRDVADAVKMSKRAKSYSLDAGEWKNDMRIIQSAFMELTSADHTDAFSSDHGREVEGGDDEEESILTDTANWYVEVKEIIETAKNQLNQTQQLTDEVAARAYDLCLRHSNQSASVDINSTMVQMLEEANQRLKTHAELLTNTLEETLEPLLKELDDRNKTEDTEEEILIVKELDALVKKFHQDLRKIIFMLKKSEDLAENPTEYLVENDKKWCKRNLGKLITPSSDQKLVSSINKLQDDAAMSPNLVLMYVLASLSGTMGLVLLMIPPSLGYYSNIMCVFYSFGMIAYGFGFYGFDMTSTIGYTQESYERVEFAVYAIGALGGTFFAIIPILYSQTHMLTLTFVGASIGAVLGIQANTLGLYTLSSDPVYFTIALAISGGVFVFGMVWLLIAMCKKEFGPRQTANTFAQCWIGSYLFVKMIGVIVGTYPNEYTLSTASQQDELNTALYIGFMIFIAILAFIIQYCCYRPYAMIEASMITSASYKQNTSKGKIDADTSTNSSSSSSSNKKKSINLHEDDRNRQKQQQQLQLQQLQSKSTNTPVPSSTRAPSAPRVGYDGNPVFGGMRSRQE